MKWDTEVENIKFLVKQGSTCEQIGKKYDVSKQRMYQILTKYGIDTPCRKKKNFLRDKHPKYYWVNRMLAGKLPKQDRLVFLERFNIPEYCPILGIKLNYDGFSNSGWIRDDSSPSIDRIDSTKGYTYNNIHIISWRANRIKNDGTPEEHRKIAEYIENLNR